MKKINCILLVDDEESDNFFHEIIIRQTGVCNHIKFAIDGESALDYLIKSDDPGNSETHPRPDIIYLDINMPRMNGFEFLEEYQKMDEKFKSKVVIIMLSTSLNPGDKAKAMSFNDVREFQNKPLRVENIIEVTEKYF